MKTKGTILIISNNADLQAACRQALEPGRFSVQVNEALPERLCPADGKDIDIILLDAALLPDQPETNLQAQPSVNDPEKICILLSGPSTWNKALQMAKSGAYDVLPLPVVPELLTLRLDRALEWRTKALELSRLQILEQDVSRLFSVTKGELETSELFDKDFLAPAAFRLTIAHEFRAPLAALQSFLLLLLKGYVAPEKWNEMIQHALDRSEDLLSLVDNLMNLATARHEMSRENRTVVQLGDELEKVLPSLQSEGEGRGLSLTLTIRHKPAVEVHPNHMKQLWTNLISNAIKYTPSGGRIGVTLDQDEANAIGIVEDTGIGISPQDLPFVFHEFFRTLEAKRMERRGTGLGLPLVKRIVEGYDGSVEVKSAPGEGSHFRFTLPLAATPPVKEP
ncbi:MAG: ATP-binding protein [Smithellaceae bacterium]|nr:ATP-binding protein [Smithellaceae bacterium]